METCNQKTSCAKKEGENTLSFSFFCVGVFVFTTTHLPFSCVSFETKRGSCLAGSICKSFFFLKRFAGCCGPCIRNAVVKKGQGEGLKRKKEESSKPDFV
jgi:hypothetical protein